MHTASGMGIVCLRSAVCHVWEGWLLLRSCPCTSAVLASACWPLHAGQTSSHRADLPGVATADLPWGGAIPGCVDV